MHFFKLMLSHISDYMGLFIVLFFPIALTIIICISSDVKKPTEPGLYFISNNCKSEQLINVFEVGEELNFSIIGKDEIYDMECWHYDGWKKCKESEIESLKENSDYIKFNLQR